MEHGRALPTGLNRRAFLGAAACTWLSACANGPKARQPFFARHGLPIGLQLYSLGDVLLKNFDGVLAQLAAIGYRTVELPSYLGRTPAQLRQALDRVGLTCTSAHMRLTAKQDFAKLAEAAHVIGFDRVVMPMFEFPAGTDLRLRPGEDAGDARVRAAQAMRADQWKEIADLLNRSGEALRKHGLRVGYHNHNVEFVPGPDGRTGMDILFAETDPGLVCFEMDVGWVAAAGLDPIALLRRHRGRFELMHVKDLKPTTKPNYAFRMDPTEVGSGSVPWQRVLPEAYAAGVRRFFVEQEPPFAHERLQAVKISFDYLNSLAA